MRSRKQIPIKLSKTELRANIVRGKLNGQSNLKILKELSNQSINLKMMYRTMKLYRETGGLENRKKSELFELQK